MNDSIKKPIDILKQLLPSEMLADDLELIEDKLNKAIEALEFYADKTNYLLRGFMNEVVLADNGKIARETLDEIRKRSTDLCGEKTKESQDKEVEEVE